MDKVAPQILSEHPVENNVQKENVAGKRKVISPIPQHTMVLDMGEQVKMAARNALAEFLQEKSML